MIDYKNSKQVKAQFQSQLKSIKGVTGIGIGLKEKNGKFTGELAILVGVVKKKSLKDLTQEEIIPPKIQGIKTDVIECGYFTKCMPPTIPAGMDTTNYRPLKGGATISIRKDATTAGYGSLGCFARTTQEPAGKIVLLTNKHILAGDWVSGPSCWGCTKGTGVGQPDYSDSNIIAHYLRGEDNGYIDAAIATLKPGVQYCAEIVELVDTLGPIRGKVELNEITFDILLEMLGRGEYYIVKFRGARSGIIKTGFIRGIEYNPVVDPEAVFEGPPPRDTVFIEGIPANQELALQGDSGSAILNTNGYVVGLLCGNGRNLDSSKYFAYASPINRITNDLHIEIEAATAAGQIKTTPENNLSSSDTVPDAGWGPAHAAFTSLSDEDHIRYQQKALRDLESSNRGRDLLSVWTLHQRELNHLVNTNRRVAAVWHRSGCSALLHHLVRSIMLPERIIPKKINGRPVTECFNRFKRVLKTFASQKLKADIENFEGAIAGIGGLSYKEIMETLK